jgi:glycosyltransferase involved in cell wall biosynthesis
MPLLGLKARYPQIKPEIDDAIARAMLEVSMHKPNVTFVVPCFRLAHFLRECVDSILHQSYPEIEVIILDDQSPDDTGEVARKILADYPDRPVSYVLNEQNLGNIRNYNKGIQMARGRYVWILSPDDRLRDPDVVEKYVRFMDAHLEVGYAFCAVHRIEGANDAGVHRRSVYRPENLILDSRKLVEDIVDNNFELVAASVLIRKECYETVTLFPPDMPHRGDSYVWALIALRYRVAYFSDAMVDYRIHDGSMMTTMARTNMARMIEDDIAVPWRVKAEAARQDANEIATHCSRAIVSVYEHALLGFECRGQTCGLTPAQFESSLARWEPDPAIASTFRSTVAAALYCKGLWKLSRGQLGGARRALVSAIRLHPRLLLLPPLRSLFNDPRFRRALGFARVAASAREEASTDRCAPGRRPPRSGSKCAGL